MMMGESLSWEPPGEGPWELDDSHFDRPLARYASDLFCEGFSRGQAESFERSGVPMKGIRVGLVHGLPFMQMVPILGKPSDAYKAPPPAWLFKLVSFLHPELRRRSRTMNDWLERRGWRADLVTWDEELKPELLKRFAKLHEVDLPSLSDEALARHLAECNDAFVANLHAHFHTNPTTVFPVGLFLHRALEWTDRAPLEVIALLEDHELNATRAGAAIADWVKTADDEARATLADPATTAEAKLEALRERDDAVGEAVRAWFATVAYRQVAVGDLAYPLGIEVPSALVAQLVSALEDAGERAAGTDDGSFWSAVPDARREALESLYREARAVYRLRDERSELDAVSGGTLRRALLEAGERLVRAGRLRDALDVVDVETDELAPLLLEGRGPSADEIRRRGDERRSVRMDEVPHVLGADEPPPPPPTDLFTGAMGDLFAAIMTYRALMEDSAPAPEVPEDEVLEGLAASGGRYTGTARICTDPAHFAAVESGDVLVARATMPAYNVLLPIVGAVVTDRGGALCHAAIVSREYGLPCVVGTREATARIRDGDVITVDGDSGRVEIAGEAVERAS